jgi:endonuclease YncB( thermonuclease family)
MSGSVRPDRPKARPRRFGNVIPLRRSRRGGWRISPIVVALPLAVFTAVFTWDGGPPGFARIFHSVPTATTRDPESGYFGKCWGRQGETCVIDGDSLNYQGRQIRIADIDAPELGSPKCDAEFELGQQAETRLQQLLNQGPFRLVPVERSQDRYRRELFVLTRQGVSLGKVLEREGLAHPWVGHKLPWC